MQGTSYVRSLVRLLLGAVLLCVAWILLSSTQAGAAERGDAPGAPPAKVSPAAKLSSGAKLSPGANLLPAKAKANPPVVLEVPDVPVSPVVARLERVVAAAVPVVREPVVGVKQVVVKAVPAVQEPVTRLEQVVVAVVDEVPVDEVPVMGGPAAVALPLPGTDGAVPLPWPQAGGGLTDKATKAVESGPKQTISPIGAAPANVMDAWQPLSDLRARDSAPRTAAVPTGEPAPTLPWPGRESSPLPPTSPSGGAGQGASDLATTPPAVVLLRPGVSGRDRADWHVPGSLPTHPGSRPD